MGEPRAGRKAHGWLAIAAALIVSAGQGLAAPSAADGVQVTERRAGAQTELVLENGLVSLTVTPRLGGSLSEIMLRQTGPSDARAPSTVSGKLFLDFAAGQTDPGDWSASAYSYEIPEGDADESSVHVWRKGATGPAQYITIHKTYVLKRGDARVRVDYRIENDAGAVNPVTLEYCFRCTMAGKSVAPKCFLPAEGGVQAWAAASAGPREMSVTPAKPWLAVQPGPAGGVGLGLAFGSPDLERFHVAAGEGASSVAWRFKPVSIKAGSQLAASVYLIPMRGLTDAGNALAPGIAAAMERQAEEIR